MHSSIQNTEILYMFLQANQSEFEILKKHFLE